MIRVEIYSRLVRSKRGQLKGILIGKPREIDGGEKFTINLGWSLCNLNFEDFDLVKSIHIAEERLGEYAPFPPSLVEEACKFKQKAIKYFTCPAGIFVDGKLIRGVHFEV